MTLQYLLDILENQGSGEVIVEKEFVPYEIHKDTTGDVFELAHEAGMEAGNESTPAPMVVGTPSTPLGSDVDPDKTRYFVSEGVCGFSWVNIQDGRTALAKLAKTKGFRKDSYYGGVTLWVHQFGQSYDRKMAYARAFAKVLQEAYPTYKIYASGRLD